MYKRRSVSAIVVFIIIFMSIFTIGCPVVPVEPDTGDLTITLPTSLSGSRDIDPDISLIPATFTITGAGPEGASFSVSDFSGTMFSRPGLTIGSWAITVSAYNADGTLIGDGSGTVDLTIDGANLPISINILPGDGTIDIVVSFDTYLMEDPRITATLSPTSRAINSFSVTSDVVNGRAICRAAGYAAGDYTLTVNLYEGLSLMETKQESVRVIKDLPTVGAVSFGTTTHAFGSLSRPIILNHEIPLAVEISSAADTKTEDETLVLTASVTSFDAPIDYVWYVDRTIAGVGPSYTLGSNLAIGTYTVKVAAVNADGTRAGSDIKIITVTSGEQTEPVYSIPLTFVEGGTFTMGGTDNGPTHDVTLGDFYIGTYEITHGDFYHGAEVYTSGSYQRGSSYPADNISWYRALAFCNELSITDGLTPVYTIKGSTDPDDWDSTSIPSSYDDDWDAVIVDWTAHGYRLPTEAEWEYAARGGNNASDTLYAGSNTIADVSWYQNTSYDATWSKKVTHPVGEKAENELHIFDMSGNVEEWCWDWYNVYSTDEQTDPHDATPQDMKHRVQRGGAYNYIDDANRVFHRRSYAPYSRTDSMGMRVVLNPGVTMVPVTGVDIIEDDQVMNLSGSLQLHTGIIPSNATMQEVLWESDDPSIISVDENGLVTANQVGDTVIRVKTVDSRHEDSINLEVKNSLFDSATMARVEGGTFMMGAYKHLTGKETTVSSFYISTHEVTQNEYLSVMGENPSYFQEGDTGSCPVEQVNWYEAVIYCNKLSVQDDLTPVYSITDDLGVLITDTDQWIADYEGIPGRGDDPSYNIAWHEIEVDWLADGYRLPTEAEWEFAAHGGTSTEGYRFSGSDTIDDVAWYGGNSNNKTHAVGELAHNELGLYDMSGNVSEWCWSKLVSYGTGPLFNPTGSGDPAEGSSQVERMHKGYYYNLVPEANSDYLEIGGREYREPSQDSLTTGFRIAAHDKGDEVRVTGIEIEEGIRAELEIVNEVADTITLHASVKPETASNRVFSWSSTNESVATVDEDGLVTAVSDGLTVIIATTEEGGYTDRFVVFVKEHFIPMVSVPGCTLAINGVATAADFKIGMFEVTQAQYEEVMGSNPSGFLEGEDAPNRPVEMVSWFDAILFCNTLSIEEGLTPYYMVDGSVYPDQWDPVPESLEDERTSWISITGNHTSSGYRLPTEAEWLIAANGGADREGYLFSGGNQIDDVAWYGYNSGRTTHPVGEKQPNELGLFDMTGNVSELVWDSTPGQYIYTDFEWCKFFGGSYMTSRWDFLQPKLGIPHWRNYRNVTIGFRVARYDYD